MPIPNKIRSLFSLDAPVDRRNYVRLGLALMALKYTVDAAVIYAATGVFWHPLDYLLPMLSQSHSGSDRTQLAVPDARY